LALLVAGVCLAGAAAATYYLVDYVLFTRIPAALAGTWVVQGGKQDGVRLEFQRNGNFLARLSIGGEAGVVHARAEVDPTDEKVLRITSTDQMTGRNMTKTHIIRSLTEKELLLEDPTGEISKLVRVE
jgi:hypothetical protein